MLWCADEEKENQDLENVQKQLQRLQEQLGVLPEKVEQLQREAKREEQILDGKKAELERSEKNKKLRMKEYTQGVSYYQQLLGLEFERSSGTLRRMTPFISQTKLTRIEYPQTHGCEWSSRISMPKPRNVSSISRCT